MRWPMLSSPAQSRLSAPTMEAPVYHQNFNPTGRLWLSALLTLYTGWDYFRAGARHLIKD